MRSRPPDIPASSCILAKASCVAPGPTTHEVAYIKGGRGHPARGIVASAGAPSMASASSCFVSDTSILRPRSERRSFVLAREGQNVWRQSEAHGGAEGQITLASRLALSA